MMRPTSPRAPTPRGAMKGARAGGTRGIAPAASSIENDSRLRVLLGSAACGLHGRNSRVVSDAGSY